MLASQRPISPRLDYYGDDCLVHGGVHNVRRIILNTESLASSPLVFLSKISRRLTDNIEHFHLLKHLPLADIIPYLFSYSQKILPL